jgi:hypothetical protein
MDHSVEELALIPRTSCEKGDVIAIVHGCNTPLLLASNGDGTYYESGTMPPGRCNVWGSGYLERRRG